MFKVENQSAHEAGSSDAVLMVTVKQAHQMTQLSESFLYKSAAAGIIPSVRVPSINPRGKRKKFTTRFKVEDLRAFVDKYRNPGLGG